MSRPQRQDSGITCQSPAKENPSCEGRSDTGGGGRRGCPISSTKHSSPQNSQLPLRAFDSPSNENIIGTSSTRHWLLARIHGPRATGQACRFAAADCPGGSASQGQAPALRPTPRRWPSARGRPGPRRAPRDDRSWARLRIRRLHNSFHGRNCSPSPGTCPLVPGAPGSVRPRSPARGPASEAGHLCRGQARAGGPASHGGRPARTGACGCRRRGFTPGADGVPPPATCR